MDISKIKFQANNTLPDIQITTPNLRDAQILQESLAGMKSETTSILTYLYQSYVVEQFDEDIAHLLKQIAKVEMRHQNKLSTMIYALGGDPIIASQGRFWTGKYVNYCHNLKDILIMNIQAEEHAVDFYRYSIERICTEDVKKVLECIIEDELVHIAAFKEVLEYITFWK